MLGTQQRPERSTEMEHTETPSSSIYPFAAVPSYQAPPFRLRAAETMLSRAWEKRWADRPTLDPEGLIHKAVAQTGLQFDEDGTGWRARLEVLCSDLEREARLTSLGRTIAHGQLVSALSNRLRAHALWRRHPGIGEQPLPTPIIVVGQMRSGTTRMQRLLACDPRLTYTRFYESWNPLPLRASRTLVDDRKLRGWFALCCARILNPTFDTIHPTSWNAADEEIGLHSLSVFGSAFEAQWRVPNFCAAVEDGNNLPVYHEFRRLLQTLAWQRGDTSSRPWILKVPQFTQDLAVLLQVFPDARLVCLKRDRTEVIDSSVSLVHNQMTLQSHSVDPQWIRREWARKVKLRDDRTASALAHADVPQVEIAFDDVSEDWESEMRRVYEMLRMTLPAKITAAMRSYTRSARRHSFIKSPPVARSAKLNVSSGDDLLHSRRS
jgi:hypothetical protein